jgi:hypothetical protein
MTKAVSILGSIPIVPAGVAKNGQPFPLPPGPRVITVGPAGRGRRMPPPPPAPAVFVGQAWERDGKRRQVVLVRKRGRDGDAYWAVRWAEPDGREFEASADTFTAWVNGGAVRVD